MSLSLCLLGGPNRKLPFPFSSSFSISPTPPPLSSSFLLFSLLFPPSSPSCSYCAEGGTHLSRKTTECFHRCLPFLSRPLVHAGRRSAGLHGWGRRVLHSVGVPCLTDALLLFYREGHLLLRRPALCPLPVRRSHSVQGACQRRPLLPAGKNPPLCPHP